MISSVLWLLNDMLSLKIGVNKQKNLIFCWNLKATAKKSRILGSVIQCTDPRIWILMSRIRNTVYPELLTR
jgi:hypothetical protein